MFAETHSHYLEVYSVAGFQKYHDYYLDMLLFKFILWDINK